MEEVTMGAVWNSVLGWHDAPTIKKARKSRINAKYQIFVNELGEWNLVYSGYNLAHAFAIQRQLDNARIRNSLREILVHNA
jgi:hypothetical protein